MHPHAVVPKVLSRNARVFLILFICLLAISATGVFVLGNQMLQNQCDAYHSRLERETERLFSYFEQSFDSSERSCSTIFSSRWYTHYRNVAGLYEDEFHALKRIEITQTLQSLVSGMPFVSDVLIITPANDSVITRSGWYTLESYHSIYPNVEIDVSGGTTTYPAVRVSDSSLCILTQTDTTLRHEKTLLCLLIDKALFSAQIQKMLPENCVYVDVLLDAQTLYHRDGIESQQCVTRSSPRLTFTVGYLPFSVVERPQTIFLLSLLMIALTLLSALVSLLFTRIINRPLAQMILQCGGQKSDLQNPFHFLQEYFDRLTNQSSRLSAENESLQMSKAHFLSMMNAEIYLALLTNPHFHFEDEYIRSVIPELNEDTTCMLLCFCPRSPSCPPADEAAFSLFRPYCTHMASTSINGKQFLFLWCPAQQADSNEQAARACLLRLNAYNTLLTRVNEPSQFHPAYLSMCSAMERMQSAGLPISVEKRIITMLHANQAKKCREYVQSLRGSYASDMLLHLLTRFSEEIHCSLSLQLAYYDAAVLAMDEDAQWNVLDACIVQMSTYMVSAQPQSQENAAAQRICQYVRQHYNDPDLSVAQLADRFDLHRTIISKLIKQQTGETFSDFLQALRIEESKRLLRESQLSLSAIAERVGYSSYITFKRAFTRVCGCSPREYCAAEDLSSPQEEAF